MASQAVFQHKILVFHKNDTCEMRLFSYTVLLGERLDLGQEELLMVFTTYSAPPTYMSNHSSFKQFMAETKYPIFMVYVGFHANCSLAL